MSLEASSNSNAKAVAVLSVLRHGFDPTVESPQLVDELVAATGCKPEDVITIEFFLEPHSVRRVEAFIASDDGNVQRYTTSGSRYLVA